MSKVVGALAKSFYAVGEGIIDDTIEDNAYAAGKLAAEKAASSETDWDDEALEKSAIAGAAYARGVRETQAQLRGQPASA